MDSIASFTIETGGHVIQSVIYKQHGDVTSSSCHSEKMRWNQSIAVLGDWYRQIKVLPCRQ